MRGCEVEGKAIIRIDLIYTALYTHSCPYVENLFSEIIVWSLYQMILLYASITLGEYFPLKVRDHITDAFIPI